MFLYMDLSACKDSKITDQPAHRSSQNTFGEGLPPYSVCVWHLGFWHGSRLQNNPLPTHAVLEITRLLEPREPAIFSGRRNLFSRICQNCFAFSTSNSIGTVAPKQCFCNVLPCSQDHNIPLLVEDLSWPELQLYRLMMALASTIRQNSVAVAIRWSWFCKAECHILTFVHSLFFRLS